MGEGDLLQRLPLDCKILLKATFCKGRETEAQGTLRIIQCSAHTGLVTFPTYLARC